MPIVDAQFRDMIPFAELTTSLITHLVLPVVPIAISMKVLRYDFPVKYFCFKITNMNFTQKNDENVNIIY